MAQLVVILMCPAERGPPAAMRLSAPSATKRSMTQNAAYVPRNIIGELMKLAFIKGSAGVGCGLVDGVDGEVLESAAVLHDALLWAG